MKIFLRQTKISFSSFDKWFLKILYYDRMDLSKGIDPDKSNNIEEYMV